MALEAIYEQGNLRLLKPLSLPEGSKVSLILISEQPNIEKKTPADILADLANLPLEGSQDEFSGRDHDRLLYDK